MKPAKHTYNIQDKYWYLNDPRKVTPGSLIQGLRNLTRSFFLFLDWTLIEPRPILSPASLNNDWLLLFIY